MLASRLAVCLLGENVDQAEQAHHNDTLISNKPFQDSDPIKRACFQSHI
jgi:hypothetical protein